MIGILVVALVSLLPGAQPAPPASPPIAIGYIEELFGTVLVRTDKKAKPIALDVRRDAARRLFAGEQMQCGRGAIVRIRRAGSVERLRCPSGWITLKRLATPQASAAEAVLAEYGRLSERGPSTSPGIDLFSPSDRGVVIPSEATIRWTPIAQLRTISLILTEGRREIWRQDRVDGRTGVVVSADLREVLLTCRLQHQGTLSLAVIDADNKQGTVTFTLLAEASEKKLREELARWDRESGRVMPRLGRAEVFARNRMFAEAAAEYDLALRAAPASHDLLVKAIDAHREAGDFKAAADLEARLPRPVARH